MSAPPEKSDFLRAIVAEDLRTGKHSGRVVTRFPPEPNGYPHIGHAKSFCLNFGVAREHGGICHLRYDDTNPSTEDPEFVEAIQRDVRWVGFDWGEHLYFASDYFEQLYEFAEQLIEDGLAYVCSLSEAEISEYRGTVTEPGRASPYRERSVAENLDLFRRMRGGELEEGEHVLRAKIDMAAANMKLRDPILYRIRKTAHYRRGNAWCIYPMYDFAHPLSDAIEGITHSFCTLEFENNRDIYDWLMEHVRTGCEPPPQQYEFARLKVSYTVLSKRKLSELVEGGHVEGWDDPRMPTLSGLRRRGYTPESIRGFCDRIGVAKANSVIDVASLEHSIRDDLNPKAPRALCVLRPLKVVIENYPEGKSEEFDAPYFPHDVPGEGSRPLPFSRDLYIEREDFMEDPPKKYLRLAPGREVRLRHAYVLKCERAIKNAAGEVVELRCTYDPESRDGKTANRRVKGTLHWVSAEHARLVEVRLYDRLFSDPEPDRGKGGPDFKSFLNPESLEILTAKLEPAAAAQASPGSRFQFERQGYFYTDPQLSEPGALVFNRIVSLRDSWGKVEAKPEPVVSSVKASSAATGPRRRRRRAKVEELSPAAAARFERLQGEHGLSEAEARVVAETEKLTAFFDRAVAAHANAPGLAGWIVNDLRRELKGRPLGDLPFGPSELAELVALVDAGSLSGTSAKQVFAALMVEGGSPKEIVERLGLARLDDRAAVESAVDEALAAHPDQVAEYRAGKVALLGFFVGQIMRQTRGRADAAVVKEVLGERLG